MAGGKGPPGHFAFLPVAAVKPVLPPSDKTKKSVVSHCFYGSRTGTNNSLCSTYNLAEAVGRPLNSREVYDINSGSSLSWEKEIWKLPA